MHQYYNTTKLDVSTILPIKSAITMPFRILLA